MASKKKINVNDFSLASLHLDIYFDTVLLASGTGFIYYYNSKCYLITNWHNVSGRNPENNQCLNKNLAIPNKLIVKLFSLSEGGTLIEDHEVKLINELDKACWLEHPTFAEKVDVVAIPLNIEPNDKKYHTINRALENTDRFQDYSLEIGDDAFIVGYPFSLKIGGFLPIWKRASIASEPEIDIDDKPLIYVDTASKKGMSGSPVIIKKKRPVSLMSEKENYLVRHYTKLIGIYSGRIGVLTNNFSEDIQLGRVWKTSVIEEILNQND